MLDVIIAAVIMCLAFAFKKILPEGMDEKLRESMVIMGAFISTLIVVFVYYLIVAKGWIRPEMTVEWYRELLIAVGVYEVIFKQVIAPAWKLYLTMTGKK